MKIFTMPSINEVQDNNDSYLGQFIPLHYHHHMLISEYRMGAFKTAIEQTVFPGAKILELGGGTGVLSWFAAAKAEKVWCVEYNPDLVKEATRLLKLNTGSEHIEVIQGDAFTYLPPEPVDLVICEMLHPAMLVEKQINVIKHFKERYTQHISSTLPRFLPEAVILAVQPIQQNYVFMGFHAPIIEFQIPETNYSDTQELAEPLVYSTVDFSKEISEEFSWEGEFTLETGTVNALRFITKNILCISGPDNDITEWHNPHMILPLPEPIIAKAGDLLQVSFNYSAGGSLSQLQNSIQATLVRPWNSVKPT